ncbi:MAG: hypothetical protein II896_03905 [Clostridia bacterium]|nr:hypothetical protein [Clostridia bacterium]
MNYQTTINYEAPRPIKIGDVFYRLQEVDTVNLQAKCKMCDGTHQITINGITERCPHCQQPGAMISRVHRVVVRRYRVYGFRDRVEADEWKPSTYHTVTVELYRKVGKGYYYGNHDGRDENIDFLNRLNVEQPERTDHTWYDDYAKAVAAAEFLTSLEQAKLDAFNAEHGTDYQLTATAAHDPKSK